MSSFLFSLSVNYLLICNSVTFPYALAQKENTGTIKSRKEKSLYIFTKSSTYLRARILIEFIIVRVIQVGINAYFLKGLWVSIEEYTSSYAFESLLPCK